MKNKAVFLLIILLLILTAMLWAFSAAFAKLPSAGSMIHMPKQVNILEGLNPDELQGIEDFLPKGASLINQIQGTDNKKILKYDFNGDKKNELLYCYRDYENSDNIGITVLSNSTGTWVKVLQIDKELLDIDLLQLSDLTGDGNYELLIGWKEQNLELNGLDIYTWKKDGMNKIYGTFYSKLEIDKELDRSKHGDRDKLIIWRQKDIFYTVDVVAWDNAYFVEVSDFYPEVYQDLINYYEKYGDSLNNLSQFWYFKASAYMSAQEYSEAISCIDKALTFNIDEISRLSYIIIKANCLTNSNKGETAEKMLLDVIDDCDKIADEQNKNLILMYAYYNLGKYYFYSKDYLKAYDYYNISDGCCRKLFGDNNELYHYQAFRIQQARTDAATLAFAKKYRPKTN